MLHLTYLGTSQILTNAQHTRGKTMQIQTQLTPSPTIHSKVSKTKQLFNFPRQKTKTSTNAKIQHRSDGWPFSLVWLSTVCFMHCRLANAINPQHVQQNNYSLLTSINCFPWTREKGGPASYSAFDINNNSRCSSCNWPNGCRKPGRVSWDLKLLGLEDLESAEVDLFCPDNNEDTQCSTAWTAKLHNKIYYKWNKNIVTALTQICTHHG